MLYDIKLILTSPKITIEYSQEYIKEEVLSSLCTFGTVHARICDFSYINNRLINSDAYGRMY